MYKCSGERRIEDVDSGKFPLYIPSEPEKNGVTVFTLSHTFG